LKSIPRWLCSFTEHWGFLREERRIDEQRSEYVCRACGWHGVRKRPSNKIRWHWF